MEQTLETPQEQTLEAPIQESTPSADPFAIDEQELSTLAPEARVAFDNVTKKWRSKVDEYSQSAAQKAAEEASSRYKDYDEQKKYADALRQLTQDPRFVQWYQQVSQQGSQTQVPQVASPEEWAQAVQEAASGNSTRMQAIIGRQFQIMAAPTMRQFQELQMQTQQDREIDTLFKAHPDAEELDELGRETENDPSLLEWAIYDVVDKKGGTFEQAYLQARRIADQINKKSKDAALGLVNGKKQSVTEKTSQQSKESDNIIEVASANEALRKNVEASMKGQKVTYVAKNRVLGRK